VGVDEAEEEEPEDRGEDVLCICWRRAGGGGFKLGDARLWSALKTLGVAVPLVVVVCVSTSGMLEDVLLEGVESAWLEAVPVDDGDDNGGGEGEVVVGIHEESESESVVCSSR